MYSSGLLLCQPFRGLQIVHVHKILSKVGTTVAWCGRFGCTARFYTYGKSSKSLFKDMFFNAATSQQSVAKQDNLSPVAAHLVAAHNEREWRFLFITAEIRCPSTDGLSSAGVACKATVYCTHAP